MDYTQESFEKWKKEIPSKLTLATEDFAKENKLKLDFSIKSLDALEKWILNHYDVAADLKDEAELLDLLAVYVGETYRIYIGGEWFVDLENDKSVYYKKIVIRHANGGNDFYRSAQALCTTCISRKKGSLISSTLKKSIEHIEKNRPLS